jgi:hypothetical protein
MSVVLQPNVHMPEGITLSPIFRSPRSSTRCLSMWCWCQHPEDWSHYTLYFWIALRYRYQCLFLCEFLWIFLIASRYTRYQRLFLRDINTYEFFSRGGMERWRCVFSTKASLSGIFLCVLGRRGIKSMFWQRIIGKGLHLYMVISIFFHVKGWKSENMFYLKTISLICSLETLCTF